MDSSLFSFVQKFSLTGKSLKVDDDLIDRLNHHYTVSLLLIFTVIISAKQYMGSPIQCWIPQHYPDSWEAYAENYCWVKNTYFVKDQIPANRDERRDGEIGYYQWVPFVLALQAFMFYLPVLFWRLSYWHTGIDVQDIVAKACQVPSCRTLKERRDAAEIIATLLKSSIRLATSQSRSWMVRMKKVLFFTCGGHRRGNVLALLYLFVKLLYLVNVIGQIFLLNYFLDAEHHMFGFRLLDNLIRGHDWQMTGIFPRITYCDFRMRSIGQGRPQTIQCVLPMNLFNEKIYICLWIWFVIVAVLTLINTVKWLAEVCYRPSSTGFVLQHLRVANVQGLDEEGADHDIRRLVEKEIKNDGMFVLRLINSNASYTVACMILKRLWNDRNKPKTE